MADLIWKHIIANDVSAERCEQNMGDLCTLVNKFRYYEGVENILNDYLETYSTPRYYTVALLILILNNNVVTLENVIAYTSNNNLDENSKDFLDIYLYFGEDYDLAREFIYRCYKRGYGIRNDSMVALYFRIENGNREIAEYIKYTQDNGIITSSRRLLHSYTNENMLDIYTKMIGDRSVNYNIFKQYTKNFTAPVTKELRTKVLADLEKIPQFPKHADFIVPTKQLAKYIGFDYEKYKNICYDNLNIQIARQLTIAHNEEKDITIEFFENIIEKLGTKDLKFIIKGIFLRVDKDINDFLEQKMNG